MGGFTRFAPLEGDPVLDRVIIRGIPDPHPIGSFQVVFNPTTNGATVSFIVTSNRSIYVIRLKRNFTLDYGSAIILNTWSAQQIENGQTISFDDNDPQIAQNPNVTYWIDAVPQLDPTETVTVGPQSLTVNLDQIPPDPILSFDASHGAVSGGVVQIGIVFTPPAEARFGSCLIRVSGYNGVAAAVDIAQNPTSPFHFPLEQTGETVTLTAVAVSLAGIRTTGTSPTKSLTLGAGATVPAQILGATAAELTTGVQISFPASPESNVTQYSVYRGARGQGFASASSIGTVASTGAAGYSFLDTNGLTGIFEWFVYATNPAGNSTASPQILPPQSSLTSADSPVNAPANATNQATVDSTDLGGHAGVLIRIYGTGGVGSTWTSPRGFGTITVPYLTISPKSYATVYYCVYDSVLLQAVAFTDLISTLADKYVWAGKLTTVNDGGGGGSTGGGGIGGGGDGSCPDIHTWLTPELQAKDVQPGDLLDCVIDGQFLQKPVLSVSFAEAECFLVCAGEAAKVLSWDTRFDLPDGTERRCHQMQGELVLTDYDGWKQANIFAVGRRKVAKINLGGCTFAGGMTPKGHRIYSHNILPDK